MCGDHANECWAQVWLLEMNSNPALHTNCEVLKEVIPGVVMETLGEALVQPPKPSNRPLTACPGLDVPSHPLPEVRHPQTQFSNIRKAYVETPPSAQAPQRKGVPATSPELGAGHASPPGSRPSALPHLLLCPQNLHASPQP